MIQSRLLKNASISHMQSLSAQYLYGSSPSSISVAKSYEKIPKIECLDGKVFSVRQFRSGKHGKGVWTIPSSAHHVHRPRPSRYPQT